MLTDNEMAGCFGDVDYLFAVHPLDQRRALAVLNKLAANGDQWVGARAAFQEFLTRKGCGAAHVAEQLETMDRHFGPWLA